MDIEKLKVGTEYKFSTSRGRAGKGTLKKKVQRPDGLWVQIAEKGRDDPLLLRPAWLKSAR